MLKTVIKFKLIGMSIKKHNNFSNILCTSITTLYLYKQQFRIYKQRVPREVFTCNNNNC